MGLCPGSTRRLSQEVDFFFETPQEKYDYVTILHSKSLKNAAKILKISLQMKILCQKTILNRAFSIVRKGSNYMPEKKI